MQKKEYKLIEEESSSIISHERYVIMNLTEKQKNEFEEMDYDLI